MCLYIVYSSRMMDDEIAGRNSEGNSPELMEEFSVSGEGPEMNELSSSAPFDESSPITSEESFIRIFIRFNGVFPSISFDQKISFGKPRVSQFR